VREIDKSAKGNRHSISYCTDMLVYRCMKDTSFWQT
jgi:hypothetical protein